MLEMKVLPYQVVAEEGGKQVGTLHFSAEGDHLVVESLDNPTGDIWVADGLIRTTLNFGENHGIRRVDFAEAIDRTLLRTLYGDAAENGIEDVSFFFAACKNCCNFLK